MVKSSQNTKDSNKRMRALYLKLAADADHVAVREAQYAKEALAEKKFALKDAKEAREGGQEARAADSMIEAKICQRFYEYRSRISNDHKLRAKRLKAMAKEIV